MLKSSNPALTNRAFKHLPHTATRAMTLPGTVQKTGILLLLLIVSGYWSWGNPAVGALAGFGAIGGVILALITIFKKHWAPITAPLYAVFQGLFLGATSALFEANYPGIVIQAVALTAGTLFALLGAYQSGLIRATENFKLGIVAATGGVCIVYLLQFMLGFFGVSFLSTSGPFSIVFSLVVVSIAALNLVMDFDFIEQGVAHGAPDYMEWFGAFGLMVTLIWLYIEILRLLAKLRSQD
ncbi:Bax inhibitor-1/YccA family protein [Candidatus Marinamargulisbacteria bacterium]|nr:Bax inhibitor-1/YccA family protein [Candidatus Marinamargulisbacteria bacterium]